MVTFDHRDATTPEAAWAEAGVGRLPLLDAQVLEDASMLIVLAAHPDDELLGCAGLLARAETMGLRTVTVLGTLGENSHPDSPTVTPLQLAALRSEEFHALGEALFPSAETIMAGLPDGGLAAHRDELVRLVLEAAGDDLPRAVLCSPRHDDGHPDHEVLGELIRHIAAETGATALEFPIWYWHWARPEDPRWRTWVRLEDPAGLDRAGLWALYPSQAAPLSEAPGDEAIVSPEFLEHFLRGFDCFEVTAGAPTHDARTAEEVFDRLHREKEDPWELYTSDYEVAKRSEVIGLLGEALTRTGESRSGRSRFARTLEIGCSVGALSGSLAEISEQVVALDASEEALATARRRQSGRPEIDFRRMVVPADWPEGPFDLVVLSETGYYLTAEQLEGTFAQMAATASEGTPLVVALCHWRGEIEHWPLDAETVHAAALQRWPDAERLTREHEEFLLDVLIVGDPGIGGPGTDGARLEGA